MLVSGFRITGVYLIRQLLFIRNAQTIQHNMDMDIAGRMVSILIVYRPEYDVREKQVYLRKATKIYCHTETILSVRVIMPFVYLEK